MSKNDNILPPDGVSEDMWTGIIAAVARGRLERGSPLSTREVTALEMDNDLEAARIKEQAGPFAKQESAKRNSNALER